MGSLNPDVGEKQDMDDSGYVQDAKSPPGGGADEGYRGSTQLLDLSDDVLLYILRHCAPLDLKALGYSCERLGALVRDRTLWADVDCGAEPHGARRVRWLLAHALGPHTRRLRITGYAQRCQGCLGFDNRVDAAEEAGEYSSSGWVPRAPPPPEEERYLCGGTRVYRLTQTLPRYGAAAYWPESTAPQPVPEGTEGGEGDGGEAGEGCPGPQLSLTPGALARLAAQCPHLTTLEMDYCVIDCNTTHIGMFPRTLVTLSLRGTKCFNLDTKSFLFKIQDHLTLLEELDVSECWWVEPACMLPLSKLARLRALRMRTCPKLAEFVAYASLATRYGFKRLQVLDLSGSPVGDSEVSALGWLPALEELYLSPAPPELAPPPHAHAAPAPAFRELRRWEHPEPEYMKSAVSEEEWLREEQSVSGGRAAAASDDPTACILLERMVAEPVGPEEYSQVYRQFLAGQRGAPPRAEPRHHRESFRQYMARPGQGHPAAGYSLFIRKQDSPSSRRRARCDCRAPSAPRAEIVLKDNEAGTSKDDGGDNGEGTSKEEGTSKDKAGTSKDKSNEAGKSKAKSKDGDSNEDANIEDENAREVDRMEMDSDSSDDDKGGAGVHKTVTFRYDRPPRAELLVECDVLKINNVPKEVFGQAGPSRHYDDSEDSDGSDSSKDEDSSEGDSSKDANDVSTDNGAAEAVHVEGQAGSSKNDAKSKNDVKSSKNDVEPSKNDVGSKNDVDSKNGGESSKGDKGDGSPKSSRKKRRAEEDCEPGTSAEAQAGPSRGPKAKRPLKPSKHDPHSSPEPEPEGTSPKRNKREKRDKKKPDGENPDGENSGRKNRDGKRKKRRRHRPRRVFEITINEVRPPRAGGGGGGGAGAPPCHFQRRPLRLPRFLAACAEDNNNVPPVVVPLPIEVAPLEGAPAAVVGAALPMRLLHAPPPRLDRAALVTDAALRRFGRADGENINYIQIGNAVGGGGGGGEPHARPDRSRLRVLVCRGFRRVTDASLRHLASAAPALAALDLSGTAVTPRAAALFRAARPDTTLLL